MLDDMYRSGRTSLRWPRSSAVVLAVLDVVAPGCSSATTRPAIEAEGSAVATSTASASASAVNAAFSRGNVSFLHPSTWEMRSLAEGGAASSRCGEGFWGAGARIEGEGFVGVSRCPSSFAWPPRGLSIDRALRKELIARNRDDLTSLIELEADELDGIVGIGGTISLDPAEARPFGIPDGAHGVILRGASTPGANDPSKPDIYEVFCLSRSMIPGRLGEAAP